MSRLLVSGLLLLFWTTPLHSGEDAGIEFIIEGFQNGTASERSAAAHRLKALGRKSWHLFAPCLTHADPDVRRRARLLWEELLASDDGWWCVPQRGTTFDPRTKLPRVVIEKRSGAELVLVLPGRFTMGVNVGPRWEAPAHEVVIGRAFDPSLQMWFQPGGSFKEPTR